MIPAYGHTEELLDHTDATCTETGYTGDSICATCDEVLGRGTVISAPGHKIAVANYVEATCLQDGYSGDKICNVCSTTVEKGAVLVANHYYVEQNGELVCTHCSEKLETKAEVEKVTPIVKQEAFEVTKQEIAEVIEIIKNANKEELKEVVSEETIAKIEEAVEAGKDIVTEIVSNIVAEDSIAETIVEKVEEVLTETQKVAQYLDIEIKIKAVETDGNETELGTLNELNNEISFSVAIPEDLKQVGRNFFVLRIHNGKVDKLPVTQEADGSYSFLTNMFSTYVLAYEDEENISTDNTDNTMNTEQNNAHDNVQNTEQNNASVEAPVESGSSSLTLLAVVFVLAIAAFVIIKKKLGTK